ncbi:hypothetical protein DPMN_014974 [Dreissena polymorpha]|uniref:Uncharacterized protein n=1 Tax=Dreissena polymorpha TaxID=45954 RepID=A0A9D4NBZ7_DREPO|nr:hypothetical protein DPMN_014974 [Dreissena polymorpha]
MHDKVTVQTCQVVVMHTCIHMATNLWNDGNTTVSHSTSLEGVFPEGPAPPPLLTVRGRQIWGRHQHTGRGQLQRARHGIGEITLGYG